jgi:hypothetical protein
MVDLACLKVCGVRITEINIEFSKKSNTLIVIGFTQFNPPDPPVSRGIWVLPSLWGELEGVFVPVHKSISKALAVHMADPSYRHEKI